MVETPVVPDLLADHVRPLVRVVVSRRVEVAVVQLRRRLGNVGRPREDPDRGETKPTVVSVVRSAYLGPAGGRTAVALRLPGYLGQRQDTRRVPIGDRRREIRIPGRADVVTDLERHLRIRARPR